VYVQRAGDLTADAVRVLTIHKAKGLEAPVRVACSAAPRAPAQRGPHPARRHRPARWSSAKVDPMTQQLLSTPEGRTAENQRLAYSG